MQQYKGCTRTWWPGSALKDVVMAALAESVNAPLGPSNECFPWRKASTEYLALVAASFENTVQNSCLKCSKMNNTTPSLVLCVCVPFSLLSTKPQSPGGTMSRPPTDCVFGSVGNPFDRVWPPTTSGHLQPIFS